VEHPLAQPIMRCARCNRRYAADDRRWRCNCGGALDLLLPPPRLSPNLVQHRPPDLWRYREALPPLASQVSLGESMTPLIPFDHRKDLWLKCDYLLPTGSTRTAARFS
jgi:threonine synthase